MPKELVSQSERLWIRENAVKMMGTAIKYAVMDIDKVAEKIKKDRKAESMTPWVEIQPVSQDMHKMPNKVATFQKDPRTGVLYGIAIGTDQFGNIQWQKIQLHDHISLNLDQLNDARIWAAIRFHPDIQGSPWQKDNPYYKVYDPVEEARKEIDEVESMQLAFSRVGKILDDPKAMVHFLRYLGEDLRENANYKIVRGRLLTWAKNYPIDFNRRWDSKSRTHAEHFYSAKALGIIETYVDRGNVFKGIPLGLSDNEAIKFLGSDNEVMNSIVAELSEKDSVISVVSESSREFDEAKTKAEVEEFNE